MFHLVITAKDANNNTVVGYTGTIQFTSSDAMATLPAAYTFTPSDKGKITLYFAAKMKTPGTQTISVRDTVNAALFGTATVTVSP